MSYRCESIQQLLKLREQAKEAGACVPPALHRPARADAYPTTQARKCRPCLITVRAGRQARPATALALSCAAPAGFCYSSYFVDPNGIQLELTYTYRAYQACLTPPVLCTTQPVRTRCRARRKWTTTRRCWTASRARTRSADPRPAARSLTRANRRRRGSFWLPNDVLRHRCTLPQCSSERRTSSVKSERVTIERRLKGAALPSRQGRRAECGELERTKRARRVAALV